MDEHREMIWQRGDAREIMKEARKRFRNPIVISVGKYTALASVHYSLVKRYTGLQWSIALWHLWWALKHARTAFVLGITSYDQADVVSRILSRGFSRDRRRAKEILEQVLKYVPASESAEMVPHTRALMLCTLGKIKYDLGDTDAGWRHFSEARELLPAIRDEESPDREQQLVRVMVAVGFFFWEHGGGPIKSDGSHLIWMALNLACRVSKDQEMKIRARARKVDYSL